MVILSFLTTLAVSSMRGLQIRSAFRSEVFHLVRGLQEGKVIAIKRNCAVVFKIENNSYEIFVDDGGKNGCAGDWNRQQGEDMIVKRDLPANIDLTTNFTLKRTRFSNGIGNKAGRIVLFDPLGGRIVIILSISGRIRVSKS
jgi:Tfp pilus assembly protein FimT